MKVTTNYSSQISKPHSVHNKENAIQVCSKNELLDKNLNQLSFLGKSQVLKQLTKDVDSKKHSEYINECTKYAKEIKEYISSCKDNSEELKDIDTLLECFDKTKHLGTISDSYSVKLDENIFKGLGKEKKLPSAISEDLKILRKSGNLIDNYIPVLSKNEAINNTKTGEVFQIGNSKCVSIKNKSGEVEELKMTRDDFFRLFPPVSRFAGIQSPHFGNCYEETALYSIIANPETRENIFRCIDTVSNPCEIKVTFPNGYVKNGVSFNEDVVSMSDEKKYYTQGCRGIQIIQHALGLDLEKEFVDYKIKQLIKQGKDSEVMWLRVNSQKSRLLANHFNGRYYDTSLGVNLRDGGNAVVQWHKLGLKDMGESSLASEKYTIIEDSVSKKYKHQTDDRSFTNKYLGDIFTENLDGFWKRLESPDFFNSHLIQVSVSEDNALSKFSPNHSYGLRAKLNKNGKIDSYYVKNPHEITETPLSFEEVIDNFDYMSFAKYL